MSDTLSHEDQIFLIALDIADVIRAWGAEQRTDAESMSEIDRLAVSSSQHSTG